RSWTTASPESGALKRAGCAGMRRLGLVWVKISAGTGYAIRLAVESGGRRWRSVEVSQAAVDLPRRPPPFTALHTSDSERNRRERDREQRQRHPGKRTTRRGQRPLGVEHGRVTEA